MKERINELYQALDRFIDHSSSSEHRYIRVKKTDHQLLMSALPYPQSLIANRKGYFEYREFTVIPEK